MARVTKLASIENQLQKKQEKLIGLKKQCDTTAEEIQELVKQRDVLRREELLNEIENSGRNYDEILEFLKSALKRTTAQPRTKRKYTSRKAKSGD